MNQSALFVVFFFGLFTLYLTLCWVIEGWNTPYNLECRQIPVTKSNPSIKADGSTERWAGKMQLIQKDSWRYEVLLLCAGLCLPWIFPIQLAVFFVGYVRRHWFSYKLHKQEMGGGAIINSHTKQPQIFDNMPEWLRSFRPLLDRLCGIGSAKEP
jgi:hypothetical protein